MPHPEWNAMSDEQKMEFLYNWDKEFTAGRFSFNCQKNALRPRSRGLWLDASIG
jgi:hypothetical protein